LLTLLPLLVPTTTVCADVYIRRVNGENEISIQVAAKNSVRRTPASEGPERSVNGTRLGCCEEKYGSFKKAKR
jgi:hypothetical protein